MTFTVTGDSAVLLSAGGIHYDLQRVRPNVYASGYWIKVEADLSVRPKRLTCTTATLVPVVATA